MVNCRSFHNQKQYNNSNSHNLRCNNNPCRCNSSRCSDNNNKSSKKFKLCVQVMAKFKCVVYFQGSNVYKCQMVNCRSFHNQKQYNNSNSHNLRCNNNPCRCNSSRCSDNNNKPSKKFKL